MDKEDPVFFDIVHNLEGLKPPGPDQPAGPSTTDLSGPEDFLVTLLANLPAQLPPSAVAEAVHQQLTAGLPHAGGGLPLTGKALPAVPALLAPDQPVAQHSAAIHQDTEYDHLPLSVLGRQLPEVLVPDVRGMVPKGSAVPESAALPAPVFELPVLQPAPHGHTAIQMPTAALNYQSPTQTPSFNLAQPMGQQEWGDALGARVVWLARQGIQGAEVRVHPAHLGPIEIQVSITEETARVAFAAHHPHTREALEAALPQLREMFAQQGLQLADAAVSHRFPEPRDGGANPSFDRSSDGQTEPAQEEVIRPDRLRVGLVDDYA